MRRLIFGDVHHKIHRVQWLLEHIEHDEAICLGDWMDDWNDGPKETKNTCLYLRDYYFTKPNRLSMMGNHDLPYFWSWQHLRGYGCTRNKLEAFQKIMRPISRYRKLFPFYLWRDGWLISHAGLNINLIPPYGCSCVAGWLESQVAAATDLLFTGQIWPIFDCGRDRGGEQRHGGILWQDWDSLEPIPGLRQIVGHTYIPGNIRSKNIHNSQNWCLDDGLRHYAILEDGRLSIHPFPSDIRV